MARAAARRCLPSLAAVGGGQAVDVQQPQVGLVDKHAGVHQQAVVAIAQPGVRNALQLGIPQLEDAADGRAQTQTQTQTLPGGLKQDSDVTPSHLPG